MESQKREITSIDIIQEASSQDILFWLEANRIKNEKGKELEFRNHKFLEDIYNDFAPIQTVRKSAQIGFTTLMILKTFWLAKNRNLSVIYTMPSFQMVQDIASAKVNALVGQNPVLGSWLKDKDSVFQKRIGNSFIYYRGASADKAQGQELEGTAGISLTSDLNVMDECDRSSQEILEQYESRLEASQFKGKWYFSNPTSPHTLSQKLWEKSDQKHWFIKCDNGHWQYLDFWKNIKDNKFVCQKCGIEITDDNRKQGKWVRKYRGNDISGYWISHLICPWITAKQIQTEYDIKSKQYFYNFVLGLPYVGSDVVVNKDVILRNIDLSEPNFQKNNVMGIDQGLENYFILGNRQGIFKIGSTQKWDDINKLITMYDVETVVIDALPNQTEPVKLMEKYPGKVWINYYKKDVRSAEYVKWNAETMTIYSDRNKLIQQTIDDLINRKTKFQMEAADLVEYIRHFESLYKVVEKDSLGIETDVWETSGLDHYLHATNYFKLALGRVSGETKVVEWGNETPDYSKAPDIQKMIKNQ